MKNFIFLIAAFVSMSFGAFAASDVTTKIINTSPYYIDYGNSFTFVERGITFAVFQNGEFDFYLNQRNGVQFGYSNNNVNISFNSGYNYDAYVQYDDYGAIIQIENVPIYYDYYGRVTRIGSVDVRYNQGRLIRLGGLYVNYDRYGYYSHYTGYINVYNRHYVYHPYHNYFSRPLFEFRIVSYKPYRSRYRPQRYTYYRDHSRNTYYKNYSKRSNYNTRSTRHRVATKKVPKRRNDRFAQAGTSTNRNYGVKSRSISTTTRSRDVRLNRNTVQRNDKSTNRAIRSNSTSRSTINKTPKRASQSTRAITNRTPNRTVETRKSVTTRTPSSTIQRSRSVTQRNTRSNQHSSARTKSRQPSKAVQSTSRSTKSRQPATVKRSRTIETKSRSVSPRKSTSKSRVTSSPRKPVKRATTRTNNAKRKRS